MPVSQLDDRAALVVVDLQKGLQAIPMASPLSEVVSRSAGLARAFRKRGSPVVLANVTGFAPGRTEAGHRMDSLPHDWAELVPELEAADTDHRVTKQSWGAFTGTGLEDHLRKLGVTQVVLAGIATSMGVESTARQAHELGFHVVVATDSITDPDHDAHLQSVRTFAKLGETATAAELLKLLED
jgi:nicotinamidase-related amidase